VCRICAATRADIRLVTGNGQRLSLAAELAADQDILTSAGIDVSLCTPRAALPATADTVLAPVLREAVTNILRHSTAVACAIEVELAGAGRLRLRVRNDGAAASDGSASDGSASDGSASDGSASDDSALDGSASDSAGRGLLNLAARVRAAGGTLTSTCADGQFDLVAEIPLDDTSAHPGHFAASAPAAP